MKVKKNEFGVYEVINSVVDENRDKYFVEEYYQNTESMTYQKSYSSDDLDYMDSTLNRLKEYVFSITGWDKTSKRKLLDVGCGEGWLMSFFLRNTNFDVCGTDISNAGIARHNSQLLDYFIQGDGVSVLKEQKENDGRYDFVTCNGVLDMVNDVDALIDAMKGVLKKDGIFSARVANNYSKFQLKLLDDGILSEEFWYDGIGHKRYFNRESFLSYMEAKGFECLGTYAEGLAEVYLLNDSSNYYENPDVGHDSYIAKLRIEKMINYLAPEKSVELHSLLANMGLGREIVGVFRLKDK